MVEEYHHRFSRWKWKDGVMGIGRSQHRLSETTVDMILARRAHGETPRAIGRDFGISGDAVRGLIRRRQTRFADICGELEVDPLKFRKHAGRACERGRHAVWLPAQVEVLRKHFPTRTSLKRVAELTNHSYYAVLRKAAMLGLRRPPRKTASALFQRGSQPLHLSFRCTFERVLAWLAEAGRQVEPGSRAGTYRLDNTGDLTPQELVRFANNLRARRMPPLPPFSVRSDAAIHLEMERSLTGPSLEFKPDER